MASITVSLPDGSALSFDRGVALTTVAAAIGPRLAQAALAAKVDGQLVGLDTVLERSAAVTFLTWRDAEGKLVYRHSTAHILAQAVQRLLPEVKVTIGPALEDGRFYYDFDTPQPFTPEVLAQIEDEMRRIIAEDQPIERLKCSRDEARAMFTELGEPYKIELLDAIPEGETVSVYLNQAATPWRDLCRGPHVPSTGRIGQVKLLTSSGAYWRGDSNNKMLQRIYGISFPDAKELNEWLRLREEAEKRDHRKLGRELDLFWFHDVAPASPFFFPAGAHLYTKLVDLIRAQYGKYGYDEVITPQVMDVSLWQTSGHMDNYAENMYFVELDGQQYAVKPMNCPAHCLMYGSRLHSYRELPVRYADFGRLHRYEASGVTAGLTRVRSFCQDDAHIFCRADQIEAEVGAFIDMLLEVYQLFGFSDVHIDLSTRPAKAVGTAAEWTEAEQRLDQALRARGVEFTVAAGEGAFYGPKIDFMVSDALHRRHQLGTCQLDFQLPQRFDLAYIDAADQRQRPVMVHRALLGSLERFLGILIEHTAGAFPLWLAPEQVRVIPVGERFTEYAQSVATQLRAAGLRVTVDASAERMQAKIALAEAKKVPFMLVCGGREAEAGTVAVRARGMIDRGVVPVAGFLAEIAPAAQFPPL
ncbi:MAG: threonine--tRNA ligase [Fimbriimonadaceae bacterium]|nr:threonine--tRNA ligase [Fimbriimonadaceae bacterium]